jgi:hypothetical protein
MKTVMMAKDRHRFGQAPVSTRTKTVVLAASASMICLSSLLAQDAPGINPASPAIGADVPASYFGPPPSSVQRELVGEYQILKAGKVDLQKETITLPLYEGAMKTGQTVWYIVTDTDDKGNAEQLGLNYSPKLTYAEVGRAVRKATLNHNFKLVFDAGTVDFSPRRSVVAGDAPNFFPPKQFQPGSVGDTSYTPLVKITNAGGHIYNAPVVAYDITPERLNQFCDGNPDSNLVHDKVVRICPRDKTVTLQLTQGFSFAKPVLYLSTDTSTALTATAEGATYAPGMEDIQGGADDSLFSPVERIFVFVNGHTGKDNPQRQGLNSALSDGASPLNVLGGIPTVATASYGYITSWRIEGDVLSLAKDPASQEVPGDGTYRGLAGDISSRPNDIWITPDGAYVYQLYPNASMLVGYAVQPDGALDEITSANIPHNSSQGLTGF